MSRYSRCQVSGFRCQAPTFRPQMLFECGVFAPAFKQHLGSMGGGRPALTPALANGLATAAPAGKP